MTVLGSFSNIIRKIRIYKLNNFVKEEFLTQKNYLNNFFMKFDKLLNTDFLGKTGFSFM